jgi:hypothetical protein
LRSELGFTKFYSFASKDSKQDFPDIDQGIEIA